MFYTRSGSLARLRKQLDEIQEMLRGDLGDAIPRSAWCATEHLDHTLKVAESILYLLAKPSLERAPNGISVEGWMVLTTGWIPRGKGKAPEKLRGVRASLDELQTRMTALRELLDRVTEKPEDVEIPVVRHPRFGGLTPLQSLRFIVVHTHHHLKILRTGLASGS